MDPLHQRSTSGQKRKFVSVEASRPVTWDSSLTSGSRVETNRSPRNVPTLRRGPSAIDVPGHCGTHTSPSVTDRENPIPCGSLSNLIARAQFPFFFEDVWKTRDTSQTRTGGTAQGQDPINPHTAHPSPLPRSAVPPLLLVGQVPCPGPGACVGFGAQGAGVTGPCGGWGGVAVSGLATVLRRSCVGIELRGRGRGPMVRCISVIKSEAQTVRISYTRSTWLGPYGATYPKYTQEEEGRLDQGAPLDDGSDWTQEGVHVLLQVHVNSPTPGVPVVVTSRHPSSMTGTSRVHVPGQRNHSLTCDTTEVPDTDTSPPVSPL